MKGISSKEKLPKFLKVNNFLPSKAWNKYLPKPYVLGEIVKVAPWEEQVPSEFMKNILKYPELVNDEVEHFHERYVVVYRKDDNGQWTRKNTDSWAAFELLSTTIKK